MQQHIKTKTIISTAFLIVVLFGIFILLGKILTPFIIALIISYVVNPFVDKLQHKFKINRTVLSFIISIFTFFVFISVPLFILPQILLQIKGVVHNIPKLLDMLNTHVLNKVNLSYGTNFILNSHDIKNALINNIGKIYNNVDVFSPIAHNGMIIIEILVYLVLIPFILFYSTNNFDKIVKYFDGFIPKRYTKLIHAIISDVDKLLASYLRGQISVMLIMALYYSIGLNIVGLNSATVIGIMTGLLVFIPYLGILTGLIIALMTGFTDFSGIQIIIWTLVVFVIGHFLEGGIVTPYLVGGRIGLNPVMIIFALMAFGKVFGLVGVLLALPLATITTVLLQYLKKYYLKSSYYGDEI